MFAKNSYSRLVVSKEKILKMRP